MFGRWFFRKTRSDLPNQIYGGLVTLARNPVLFTDLGVPDTINGRFDMMVMHVFLLAHRLKDGGDICRSLSQEVFDAFLLDMDRGLREEGVGDTTVPKRIKKMVQVFYGRVRAYEEPLRQNDHLALAEVINRNVFTGQPDTESSALLGDYMQRMHAHLLELSNEQVLTGQLGLDVIEPIL